MHFKKQGPNTHFENQNISGVESSSRIQISMEDQDAFSRAMEVNDIHQKSLKKNGSNYNQVQPIALGRKKKSSSGQSRKPMSEKEKAALLQRIIEDKDQRYPSGMREFILGCFQLAEQNKFNQTSNMTLVQQLKDLVGKAYAEKKEYVNDWWSQTIPCLTKSRTELALVCDKDGQKLKEASSSVYQTPLPPPPPPPRLSSGNKKIPPPPAVGGSSLYKEPTKSAMSKATPTSRSSRDSAEVERRKKRMERFSDEKVVSKKARNSSDENFANLNAISTKFYKFDKNKPVVGRCQTLEKKYLRLTSEPNPDLVRPLNILKKAYELILRKHSTGEASYPYLCDQFKSCLLYTSRCV